MATSNLPTRSNTASTEEEAVPGEDTSEVTKLFSARLAAWRHAIAYLEDYVEATEKMQHAHGKEYEKVLKTVSKPLKEGEHFDQSLGGMAGMFDNIRSNTQGISNSHYETAKTLKGSVLPIFSRLHTEIKNKAKELTKGAGKGSKTVDKARNTTQKHIELLGQHTATYDSTGGKVTAANDPYVLQRGVNHRLHKQVTEENANRDDLIAVQNSFGAFEKNILQTIQQGLGQFNTVLSKQNQQAASMYSDMTSTAQRVPLDFEWNGFIRRNGNVLIDPAQPARSASSIAFPNQHHKATQPLIAGSLERKGKLMGRYDTGYYVVTPSKFLHEFKTDDDVGRDPAPELSLYLPDCVVGAVSGPSFNVKGKDASKGSLGSKLALAHELKFKAHTPQDALKWHEVISSVAGQTTNEAPEPSAPNSPVSPADSQGGQQAGLAAAMEQQHAQHAQHPQSLQTSGFETEQAGYGSVPQSAASGYGSVPQSATAGPGGLSHSSTMGSGHGEAPHGGGLHSGVEKPPGQY